MVRYIITTKREPIKLRPYVTGPTMEICQYAEDIKTGKTLLTPLVTPELLGCKWSERIHKWYLEG